MEEPKLKAEELCKITGCNKQGKVIGTFAGVQMRYCQKHKEYGNRVLNFFINAKVGYSLNRFLKETRDDWFTKNQPKLSEESELAIKEYLHSGIERIEYINKLADTIPDEIDDDEPELE